MSKRLKRMSAKTNESQLSRVEQIIHLKEQLHKSFLCQSQVQKLHSEELQALKKGYQEEICLIKQQNKELKIKIDDLQLRQGSEFEKNLENIDYSMIEPKLEKSQTSLFCQNMLDSLNNVNVPQSESTRIGEMERKILINLDKPPKELLYVFNLTERLSKENFHLRTEINKLENEKRQRHNSIEQLKQENKILQLNCKQMKEDNEVLGEMYKKQAKTIVQLHAKLRNAENILSPQIPTPKHKRQPKQQEVQNKIKSLMQH